MSGQRVLVQWNVNKNKPKPNTQKEKTIKNSKPNLMNLLKLI